MDNIIDYDSFLGRRRKVYYKNLFVEKYVYVKKNIGLIKRVAMGVDSSGNLFYQVLESMLLENTSIELTEGYKIIEDIIGKSLFEKIDIDNTSFYESVWNLSNLVFDRDNDSKYRLVTKYLTLNSMIDPDDENNELNKINLNKIDKSLIIDNDFIDNSKSSLVNIDDSELVNIYKMIKGDKNDENKRY